MNKTKLLSHDFFNIFIIISLFMPTVSLTWLQNTIDSLIVRLVITQ